MLRRSHVVAMMDPRGDLGPVLERAMKLTYANSSANVVPMTTI